MPVFHGKWAAQVLDARGIRHPGWQTMDAALGAIDESAQESLFLALNQLSLGVETPAHFADVQRFLSSVNTPAATELAPNPVCTIETDDLSWLPPLDEEQPPLKPRKASKEARADVTQTGSTHGQGLHIYAAKAAMKAELDSPRDTTRWLGRYTVAIDVAPATSPRHYDWDVKLSFQLTSRELPVFAAFLLGHAGSALAFNNHGPGNDKTLELKDQGSHVFLKLHQAKSTFALPISAPDHYRLTALVLTAMRMNSPELDGPLLLAALGRCGAMGLHHVNNR